jgi:hypothetical protein
MTYQHFKIPSWPDATYRCDRCPATGEQDMDYSRIPYKNEIPQPDEHRFVPSYWIEPMLPEGWSHTLSGRDLCPDCARNARTPPPRDQSPLG